MFAALQRLLPKHLLSRLFGRLAASENRRLKASLINSFCFCYRINLSEAERSSKSGYRSFNDFFTRALKPGVRPVAGRISSPADGRVAALGPIRQGMLIQSKNHAYPLEQLLGAANADEFEGGSFITIYLAPHNYHRVHMPFTGELHHAVYIPGSLFSVNRATAARLPNLFAENERLVCRFHTGSGPAAIVLVGALLVAGIRPVWRDSPYHPGRQVITEMRQTLEQGAELGRFEMGSTVILASASPLQFAVSEGDEVLYGAGIAH